MTKGGRGIPVGLMAVLFFFCAFSASALTKGFEAISFRPVADGGPYFTVWGSPTLAPGRWVAGTYATYAYRPFQLAVGSSRVQGILDHTLIEHFFASAGVFKWLEAGFEMPVGWWLRYQDPNIVGSSMQNKIAAGDPAVYLKAGFIDIDEHKVGIALLPFITVPAGKGEYFMGAGNVTGGGKVIVEGQPARRVRISLNAGVLAREHFDFRDIEKSHELLLGLGAAVGAAKNLDVVAEVNATTRLSGPFEEKGETPAEAIGGVKWAVAGSGVTLGAGGGGGILRGSGAPTFRTFVGVSYKSPAKKLPPVGPKAPPDIMKTAVLHFPTDGFEILDEHVPVLGKVADSLRENSGVRIRVVGFTDSCGGRHLNGVVSRRRAEKVKWYLELRGAPADRMEVDWKDGGEPRGDNRTREGRAENRRVEFEIISPTSR